MLPVAALLIKEANCENRTIYSEFSAAVFVSIEKKKKSTTRFSGPPPIPRNDDNIPSTVPIIQHSMGFFILWVFIFF